MSLYAILAIVAIASVAVIEVSIAYQKYQLKKRFLEDLDKKDTDVAS